MKFIYYAIATVLGAGKAPKAPGTAGALVPVLLFYFFPVSTSVLLSVIVAVTVAGTFVSYKIEKMSGIEDPGFIVIDEFAGQAIALLLLPHHWAYFLAAFVLFRFFDILKPLGIDKIQNIGYGIGVMADDLLAGIYALALLQIWIYWVA